MSEHVMIDVETMGTGYRAVVVSIGAVKFDRRKIYEDEGLYLNLTWQDQLDKGGTVTEDTIRFWMRQPSASREALFNKKGEPTVTVLKKFLSWFNQNVKDTKHCKFWAMPPSFDLAIVGDLFRQFRHEEPPWPFWAVCCVRTAKMMSGVDTIKRPADMTKHHAFHDAVYQAKIVRKFLNACGGPATKPPDDDLLS